MSFIPWVFVYGIINIIFNAFPGWKSPFSNTFGYLFVKMLKANPLIINLFNTLVFHKSDNDSDKNNDSDLSFLEKKTLLNNIYKDQSIMLNVITINNINSFWNNMFSSIPNAQQYRNELYNIIIVKDKVAEFIWYVLLSSIAYSMSNRYITTIKCDKSSEEMEEEAQQIDNIIN